MKIYLNSINMIIVLDFPSFFNSINSYSILQNSERFGFFSRRQGISLPLFKYNISNYSYFTFSKIDISDILLPCKYNFF